MEALELGFERQPAQHSIRRTNGANTDAAHERSNLFDIGLFVP
jgi:hypothetical protein